MISEIIFDKQKRVCYNEGVMQHFTEEIPDTIWECKVKTIHCELTVNDSYMGSTPITSTNELGSQPSWGESCTL